VIPVSQLYPLNQMNSFTLKHTITGITETFTRFGEKVEVRSNTNFKHIPSVGWLSVNEARELWKEMTQNGWVRI
jgi:hypothetical protein